MTTEEIIRQKRKKRAARKAAQTKADNRASLKRWREVDEPTNRRINGLLNYLLKTVPISVSWNPLQDTGLRLKKGAQYGKLLSVCNGGKSWIVLPEGYKQPKRYHAGFWEVLLP